MKITTNQTAFCTATFLAFATAGTALAGAAAASKAATIGYTALALACGGVNTAAVTAWYSLENKEVHPFEYFKTFGKHAAVAIPAYLFAAAQAMLIFSTYTNMQTLVAKDPTELFISLVGCLFHMEVA